MKKSYIISHFNPESSVFSQVASYSSLEAAEEACKLKNSIVTAPEYFFVSSELPSDEIEDKFWYKCIIKPLDNMFEQTEIQDSITYGSFSQDLSHVEMADYVEEIPLFAIGYAQDRTIAKNNAEKVIELWKKDEPERQARRKALAIGSERIRNIAQMLNNETVGKLLNADIDIRNSKEYKEKLEQINQILYGK